MGFESLSPQVRFMKNRNLKILITLLATILFAVLALYFSDDFTHFVLGQFKDLNAIFISNELLGQFKSTYTFVFVIAILPCLFLFANFILKDQKPWIFLVIIPITLICGVALLSFHIYSIRMEILELPELTFMDTRPFPVSRIQVARYLGIGFLMGAIISTAILTFLTRDRKTN